MHLSSVIHRTLILMSVSLSDIMLQIQNTNLQVTQQTQQWHPTDVAVSYPPPRLCFYPGPSPAPHMAHPLRTSFCTVIGRASLQSQSSSNGLHPTQVREHRVTKPSNHPWGKRKHARNAWCYKHTRMMGRWNKTLYPDMSSKRGKEIAATSFAE